MVLFVFLSDKWYGSEEVPYIRTLLSQRSAVGSCSPHKKTLTNAGSNPGGVEFVRRLLAALRKQTAQRYYEWWGKRTVKAIKTGFGIIQSHWVKDVELESVVIVWVLATAVFGNKRPAFSSTTIFRYIRKIFEEWTK